MEEENKESREARAVITEDCPKENCNSGKFYYYSMQLRGADEGSTIFYECVKCGYKYKVNN